MVDTTCENCGKVPAHLKDPKGVLFYSSSPSALPKLEDVLDERGVSGESPLDNTLAFTAEPEVLQTVVQDWKQELSELETEEIRGTLLEEDDLSSENLNRALLHLSELEEVHDKLAGRWLIDLLERDGLRVHFHPIVELATGRVHAYECLIRGEREGETVGAWPIISTAKDMGLTHLLDRSCRRAAVTHGRELVARGHKLFINFTPSSIYDPETCLADTVAVCREQDIDLGDLVFEVIESEEVEDIDHLNGIFEEYREQGAMTALDDIGSGYASVNMLAKLRPDIAKIDQELVTGAFEDEASGVLIGALIKAAHDLDIDIVAEGVETAEDLHYCAKLGVDLAQGYFFARPDSPAPQLSEDSVSALRDLPEPKKAS